MNEEKIENTQEKIKQESNKTQSETTAKHGHIYIDMLREKYKRNLELCEVVEMIMKIKAESDAQLFSLQQLLVDKEIATPEEMREAMNPQRIAELVEIVENGFDDVMLNGMGKNGQTTKTSVS